MQGNQKFCAEYGLIAVCGLLLAACQQAAEPARAGAATETVAERHCVEHGYLKTELYGALQASLHWEAKDLDCEGMRRPNGDGARLRFAGSVGDGQQLAFIIALPGLQRGETGTEYRSNVTIIEEGAGRFFGSNDREICWTDINELAGIDGDAENRFAVAGTLYCVAPLIEINGDTDVSIRDLEFRGLLDWDAT